MSHIQVHTKKAKELTITTLLSYLIQSLDFLNNTLIRSHWRYVLYICINSMYGRDSKESTGFHCSLLECICLHAFQGVVYICINVYIYMSVKLLDVERVRSLATSKRLSFRESCSSLQIHFYVCSVLIESSTNLLVEMCISVIN